MQYEVPDLLPAIPELWVAAMALTLLVAGVLGGDRSTGIVAWLSVLVLAVAGLLVVVGPHNDVTTFAGMFVADRFAVFTKILILIGSATAILISLQYLRDECLERFEYPILILTANLGMMMMISSVDVISLYLGLEIQSLSLYILASFKRDSEKSTEAGLKYFVLGALASGILLYGTTLVYGNTGATSFDHIAAYFDEGEATLGLWFGLAFMVTGLAFKVSAVPFHMWTPDVYEGAPTPVAAFFSVAPKIAAVAVFMRLLLDPFVELAVGWHQILVALSALSMSLGAFAAIGQRNIRRLLAYSSIGHIGYVLMGLAAGEGGARGVLLYLVVYLVMNLGAWSVVLSMRRDGEGLVEGIDDLAGLGRSRPLLALAMAIFLFSLAGIPPLAGFFAKFYVFLAAIERGLYPLAVIGALATVVGAFYYLRVIKVMYFDDPAEPFEAAPRELRAAVVIAAMLTLFFFLFPAPIVGQAGLAAQALMR